MAFPRFLPTRATAAVSAAAAAAACFAWNGFGNGTRTPGDGFLIPSAAAQASACTAGSGKLGVSRVVEIDTSRGPRFGLQQYQDNNFLREGEVVLTFDDGPLRRHTRMVLDALASHCTKATFYMVGQMAVADPDMAREVARAGHTIAIHTWSHKNLRAIGAAKATHEIELGISAVQRALGEPVAPFFRFPYLADSQAMLGHLSKRDFGVFSIDVDSRDFRTHDPRVMQKVLFDGLAARKKGILLFHDIQFSTAHGIRGVLDELARRGFKVVHTMPSGQAATDSKFDAMADAELNRRKKVVVAQPMASRSVVWPMTPPGVPVDRLSPQTAAVSPGVTAAVSTVPRPSVRPGAQGAAAPAGGRPAAGGAVGAQPVVPTGASVVTAPTPQVQVPAPQQPAERPVLRGPQSDDDWRQRVFDN